MKIAVVTGASSGMGREFVYEIDKKYSNLDEIWVIARRTESLEELQSKVKAKIRVLAYDLIKDESFKDLKSLLKQESPNIRILVNSSGFGQIGYFKELSMSSNAAMIDLNCKALTKMTYLCIPYMRKNAHIVQLASSAAFLPQTKFAVYAASKSYVLSLSRALNHELKDQMINVTAVCPGPVKTEFFDLAEKTGTVALYKRIVMADPKKVVQKAMYDTFHQKEVSVYGIAMKAVYVLSKILPNELILNIMDLI